MGSVTIPYLDLMLKNLRLQGRDMYERKHTVRLINMVEAGLLWQRKRRVGGNRSC